ncbi:9080_t:CDS:2, partial [Cetraspora pellucida]
MCTNIDYSYVFSLENKSVDLYSTITSFNSTIQSLGNKANNLYNTTTLFNSTQRLGTTEITCTLLVDKHNYEIDFIINQTALHFRRLLEEMLEDIKFYICHTDIYNAVQQFKLLFLEKIKNDTTETLHHLLALKTEDPQWVVVSKIDKEN